MIKKVLLICLLVLLVSCVSKEHFPILENVTADVAIIEDKKAEDIITIPGKCKEERVCISSKISALRNNDCEFIDRITCETECQDGVCKEKEIRICTPGFKCKNDLERSFQRESCSWEKREICEFGCDRELNKCHTASTDNETESDEEEVVIPVRNPTISQGDVVDVNGHNFSIYIIEESRVKLKMDDQRSDWINEGSSFTFRNGIKINVIAVLFQPYQGGKKDVIYSVG